MKRLFISLAAFAALVSCTQAELAPVQPETVNSFTVSLNAPQADTKTGLDGNVFKWSAGDELLVSTTAIVKNAGASGLADYKVYTTTSDKSESATFTSSDPIGTLPSGAKYLVMYSGRTDVGSKTFINQHFDAKTGYSYLFASVPTVQAYSSDGLAPYAMPMYAVTSSLEDVRLTSLGSVVRFKLYGSEGQKVRNIKLRSENGYYIAGPYAIAKTNSAGGQTYDKDPQTVFNAGNWYYGMWNEMSTTSNWGSLEVLLDCGEEGVALSSDPDDPTVFNIVIAHKNGAFPEVSLSVQLTDDDNYSVPVKLNLPAKWQHNKIYSFPARDVCTFDWTKPTKSIACWGDSFTHFHGAQDYPSYLKTFLGPDWYVYDGGVGGDLSYDIMMRQGSVRWKFKQNYTFSYGASTKVDTAANSIIMEAIPGIMTKTSNRYRWETLEYTVPRLINPCIINGVTCTISGGKVTPQEECSSVSGDWVTPYGATITKNADVNIFYIGRNGGHTGYKQLADQIQVMIDFAGGSSKPYLVLGFHEPISGLNWLLGCTDVQYNDLMKERFGDHFLNFNKEINARYVELLVKTGVYASEAAFNASTSTQATNDRNNVAAGKIPKSFYGSDFHPSTFGYKAEAMLIHDKLVKLGYVQDSYILSTGDQL